MRRRALRAAFGLPATVDNDVGPIGAPAVYNDLFEAKLSCQLEGRFNDRSFVEGGMNADRHRGTMMSKVGGFPWG